MERFRQSRMSGGYLPFFELSVPERLRLALLIRAHQGNLHGLIHTHFIVPDGKKVEYAPYMLYSDYRRKLDNFICGSVRAKRPMIGFFERDHDYITNDYYGVKHADLEIPYLITYSDDPTPLTAVDQGSDAKRWIDLVKRLNVMGVRRVTLSGVYRTNAEFREAHPLLGCVNAAGSWLTNLGVVVDYTDVTYPC